MADTLFDKPSIGKLKHNSNKHYKEEIEVTGIKLEIIAPPKKTERTILYSSKKPETFFVGKGNINYLCGNCEYPIAKRVWHFSLSNLVIKCPICDEYNNIPIIKDLNFKWVSIPKVEIDITQPIKILINVQCKGI